MGNRKEEPVVEFRFLFWDLGGSWSLPCSRNIKEEEGDWSLTVLDGALATVQGDGIGEAEIYRLKRRPGPG